MQTLSRVPLYKRILSYLFPVTLKRGMEEDGSPLQVILYGNDWQLASATALYSDGMRYRPFRKAFEKLAPAFLSGIKDCLILGTGLGSIVRILYKKYHARPDFYLVEKNNQVLEWAVELLRQQGVGGIVPFCCDAGTYLEKYTTRYDMICVDIFKDKVVPEFFLSEAFLSNCRSALKYGGVWIMNYIVNDDTEWTYFSNRVRKVFSSVTVLEHGPNRILISNNAARLRNFAEQ